jgi:photosystem II stability/assembly factor-like uncharacterized protein
MREICTILLCLISFAACATTRPAAPVGAPPAAHSLNTNIMGSVDFASIDTCCIVTYKGDLKLTHDGGATWDELSGEPYGGLRTTSFIDDLNGWGVAGEAKGKATLLRTFDGGKTWDQVTDLQEPQEHHKRVILPSSIKFIDQFHGWAFDAFAVCRTQDGGMTWADPDNRFSGLAYDFHFVTANTGWVWGGEGSLYHTTDGGQTWEHTSLPGEGDLHSVFFVNERRGWVLGSTPSRIYLTTDGGGTWWPVTASPDPAGLGCLYFINESEGWAAGGVSVREVDGTDRFVREILLHTQDGGLSWNELPCPTGHGFGRLYFGDSQHGWGVGQRTVYRTNDGGLSWEEVLKLDRRYPEDDTSQSSDHHEAE